MKASDYKYHFTTGRGWMNDPNGLIYKDGIYHLYFQYNPSRLDWGDIGWGHATSTDLMHWTNHGMVLSPDENGMIFSGSAISFGDEILCYYTEAGSQFTQRLARSSDGGMTLTRDKNFRVPTICKENRDPKVFYHEKTSAYVMILWLEENDFAILRSERADGSFEMTQRFSLPGGFECPNIFELDGVWFVWTAHGYYYPGTFDGFTFTWSGEKHEAYADSIPYAAQVYSGTEDVVMIPWLRIADSAEDKKWNGIMGIPRRLGILKKDGQNLICQVPAIKDSGIITPDDITDANIREYMSDEGTRLHVEVLG
ncbi:MAG: glycoside hydrolase family 32 protein [Treponema sp.]|nr:glycoside hydrolase family 32 protein [Treponema sp.]